MKTCQPSAFHRTAVAAREQYVSGPFRTDMRVDDLMPTGLAGGLCLVSAAGGHSRRVVLACPWVRRTNMSGALRVAFRYTITNWRPVAESEFRSHRVGTTKCYRFVTDSALVSRNLLLRLRTVDCDNRCEAVRVCLTVKKKSSIDANSWALNCRGKRGTARPRPCVRCTAVFRCGVSSRKSRPSVWSATIRD